MKTEKFDIGGIPAVLYGEDAPGLVLFVHGRLGCKEEGEALARIVGGAGLRVLAFDLPEHGERSGDGVKLVPWEAVPEFGRVLDFARGLCGNITLYARSIGAYLSLMSYADESFARCLFESPVVDMKRLIENMMYYAGVDEERLRAQGEITTDSGEVLSYKYYTYAKEHPVMKWDSPTSVIYAGGDFLTDRATIGSFAERFGCELTVYAEGEHWFHTPEQLRVLREWVAQKLGIGQ